MRISSQENAAIIHDLEILKREIAIEGELQQATIARLFAHRIPLLISKIRQLEELETRENLRESNGNRTALSVR